MRILHHACLVATASFTLAACASSDRFARSPFSPSPAPLARGPVIAQPEAAPPGAPLPPPSYPGSGGTIGGPAPIGVSPPPDAAIASQPLPPPGGPLAAPSSQQPVIAAPPQPGVPARVATVAPQRAPASGVVGTWTARDATGASCKLTLSSAPALDLNKAGSSGCENRDLQRVNAWKQQDGEIYLYAAGSVVGRVREGSGTMSGVIARSGAPLTLSR